MLYSTAQVLQQPTYSGLTQLLEPGAAITGYFQLRCCAADLADPPTAADFCSTSHCTVVIYKRMDERLRIARP